MKKLLILSIFILSLTGCGKNSSQDDLIFNKNQDCSKYRNEIENRINTTTYEEGYLEQLFYSPKINSCLYVKYIATNGAYFGKNLYNMLNDGFSSQPLEECGGEADNACDEFDKKVEEYKLLK